MMDQLTVIASVVQLAQLALHFTELYVELKLYEKNAISRTYGKPLGLFITTFFGSTATEYERIERVVLRGNDEETLRFRDSVISECSMTAVAGAIIAQVALTALSLPNLSLAHWTARAFLLFATVAGCLSVYYACSLSRNVGKCYQPDLVREWLSSSAQNTSIKTNTQVDEKNEKSASLSGIFILSAPYTMMSYSILAFVTGLAIYQGFVWTRMLDTDAGKGNSRNVFVAYIVSTGFCELFFLSAGAIKAVESLLRSRTQSGKPFRSDRELFGRHRSAEEALQLGEYSSTNLTRNVAASVENHDPATQQQRPKVGNDYGSLAVALEAAAKAHLLSADADRLVASEYAMVSGSQQGSTTVE